MKELTIDDRKVVLLNMLVKIDAFCNQFNIQYFLTGGTLLGAIRHKGFIPWDDDIDIAMLRDDYDKFSSLFNKKNEDVNLKWIDLNSSSDYYLPSGKVIDTRTVLYEMINGASPIGVFIDVFPIDNVGDNKEKAAKLINRKLVAERLLPLKYAKPSKKYSLIKNIAVLVCKLYPFDLRSLAFMRDKKYKKIATNESSIYCANLYGAWGVKEITLSANFSSSIEAYFEGYKVKIPVGYDNLLSDVYGDYMKLPPQDKQVSHHGNIAYWLDESN